MVPQMNLYICINGTNRNKITVSGVENKLMVTEEEMEEG